MLIGFKLMCVGRIGVIKTLLQVMESVEPGLVIQALPRLLVELRATELDLGSNFLSRFACQFDFESRTEVVEMRTELEMEVKKPISHIHPCQEHPVTSALIKIDGLMSIVPVKKITIGFEFFLRINVLERASSLPPISIGLYKDTVRFQLLDQFLSALRKHS